MKLFFVRVLKLLLLCLLIAALILSVLTAIKPDTSYAGGKFFLGLAGILFLLNLGWGFYCMASWDDKSFFS